MPDTRAQYFEAIGKCLALFLQKASDYGTSWQVMRPHSITDQLYIKARRIRTLEDTGQNLVGDSIESEFVGLVNYSVIALLVLERQSECADPFAQSPVAAEMLKEKYEAQVALCYSVLERKNHDYGEAWREMRPGSYTDLILAKIFRLKQIEASGGVSAASEGPASSYIDILNYSVFALIRLSEASVS